MPENCEAEAPTTPLSPVGPPMILQTPIDVRSTSLAVLALLAVVAFLSVAKAVFIPITIAVLVSYAVTPVVDWLQRAAKLPRAIGAGVTLCVIMVALGAGVTSIEPATVQILDLVPRATAKVNAALQKNDLKPPGTLDKMKQAASEIQKAADAAAGSPTPSPRAHAPPGGRATSEASHLNIRDYVVMGTASAVAGVGQLVVVIALVYFLLIAGDSFRRTLVGISGDALSKKRVTVQILDEIDTQIRRYLVVQVVTSALMGLVAWILFAVVGLENALFWAVVGGILHLIPYAGPTVFMIVISLVGYVQFDHLQPVGFVIGGTLADIGVVGLLVVPWLTQKVGRLNAVTIFVALLFWGWLWGVWGLLLGVPIVMAVNAVCERLEALQPISQFLGYAPKHASGATSTSASSA